LKLQQSRKRLRCICCKEKTEIEAAAKQREIELNAQIEREKAVREDEFQLKNIDTV